MRHMVLYYNNFTCLLSEAFLGSMKSAKPIVLLLSLSRLLPTDAHICDVHCQKAYSMLLSPQSQIPNLL